VYDPSVRIKEGRGAKAKIVDMTPQADMVYRTMETGLSLGSTVILLNQWRRVNMDDEVGISYGALQRFVSTSKVLVLDKRETRKAGSEDQESGWAMGRLSFGKQGQRQFRKGKRILAGGLEYVAAEDGDDRAQADLELPIYLCCAPGRSLRWWWWWWWLMSYAVLSGLVFVRSIAPLGVTHLQQACKCGI